MVFKIILTFFQWVKKYFQIFHFRYDHCIPFYHLYFVQVANDLNDDLNIGELGMKNIWIKLLSVTMWVLTPFKQAFAQETINTG